MSTHSRQTPKLVSRLRRFATRERANVAVIAAMTMLPMAFAVGMGMDFSNAARRRELLNGIADSAALAAVTPSMLAVGTDAASERVAQNAALSVFNSQAASQGFTGEITSIQVAVNDSIGTSGVDTRTAVVTYTANSPDAFANLLGQAAFAIGGTSTAKSGIAPNINFYLLVDTSPSMELAASSAGIANLVQHTPLQSDGSFTVAATQTTPAQTVVVPGCAFGCHESNPTASEVAGNPGGIDNYAYSRQLGIKLRIDEVNTAVQKLYTVAPGYAAGNNTVYNASLYTVDATLQNIPVGGAATADLNTSPTPPTLQPLEFYNNNNPLPGANGAGSGDTATTLDSALGQLNGIMPAPGSGAHGSGATAAPPQEVLLIITDGLNDYSYNGSRGYWPIDTGPASTYGSPNGSWCTTIKNRGIRIAVLYTTYVPLSTDQGAPVYVNGTEVYSSWYASHVAPVRANIAPAAKACASTGLYMEVTNDGDITTALQQLFQLSISTAYLAK
jgi:Flp pilus assembly protein TadG